MLQALESGRALYLLVVVCGLGLLSRWVVRNLYKRLIRESDNMTMTKNRYLKDFKQKSENTYRLNQGMENTRVYLEKQLYAFRFAGVSLDGWSNLSAQLTLLCFLVGGIASFASYWYRCDTYYIVLYSAVGILTGLMTMIVDHGLNLPEKKNQLLISLQDYLENTMFQRLSREGRDDYLNEDIYQEPRRVVRERDKPEAKIAAEPVASARRTSVRRARPAVEEAAGAAAEETTGQQNIQFLKKSLEQIAASREKKAEEQDWVKNLKPEELQVINEIIREYLA